MSAIEQRGEKGEVVDDPAGLAEIDADWRALAERSGSAFATPEWYGAARSHLHPQDAAAVVVVTRAGEGTIGVLPLLHGGTTARPRLAFAASAYADLAGPAAAPADAAAVARAAGPALARRYGARAVLDLGRVEVGATWWRELARAWPGGKDAAVGPAEPLPWAALPAGWDEYLAGRSGQFRNQVKRKWKALERDHELTLASAGSTAALEAQLDRLFELHDARRRALGSASALADPAGRRFLRAFAESARERGWLRDYLAAIDGEPAAAWLGWRVGDRFAYYQAGLDPRFSNYSVGFLLLAHTVRAAIEEGASEYDLMLGDEAFKRRFATAERQGCRVLLAPRGSLSYLRARARQAGRKTLRRLPTSQQERLRALRRRAGRSPR